MKEKIENIVFSRFVQQDIPFELITIRELYKRCQQHSFALYRPHRIVFHALIIITKGRGKHIVDFNEQLLFPGMMIPLTKEQVHSFSKDLNVEGIIISFEEVFITQHISEKNLFHFLHMYHTPYILIAEENLQVIQPYIIALERTHHHPDKNLKADLIRSIFITLLLQIKRLTLFGHQTLESKRFKDFLQFKILVSKHYKENHNAKEYAERLGVSYKYLNEVCKAINTTTAKAFIDNWLLLEIKRNLAEKKYTSKEIAYKMGFKEPSNFVRFFKKFTGTTPKKFQQEL